MGSGPSGILNLHKPSGPTSHDCVNRVRRVFGTRRAGHAGTLDPLASGVLVIGVGQGTRVLEYLQATRKVYRAELELGIETDSQDRTGSTVREHDASHITRDDVIQCLEPLRGDILQTPPMVSAIKVGGRKLYELARRGETIEREPRPVTVYRLDLLEFRPGARAEAELRVECSAGTYVRTLCHDLGNALGVGGAMSSLVREAVGPFGLDGAVPLDALSLETPLLGLAQALSQLPAVTVGAAEALRLAQGQFVPTSAETPDGSVRVLGEDGTLLAIATARGHGPARLLSPEKVFVTADAPSTGS